jgi:hypothetical protein
LVRIGIPFQGQPQVNRQAVWGGRQGLAKEKEHRAVSDLWIRGSNKSLRGIPASTPKPWRAVAAAAREFKTGSIGFDAAPVRVAWPRAVRSEEGQGRKHKAAQGDKEGDPSR